MIRCVVFDFDGTLADSNAIKERCFHETVADLPGGPAALAAARMRGGDRYRIFAEVARALAAPDARDTEARRLAARYGACCARGIAAGRERRGARRTLRRLRARGLSLFVNTATPVRDIGAILRRRRIAGHFDAAFGAPADKTANLRAILRRLRTRPRHVVVVGDGNDDRDSAAALGAWFVAIEAERRFVPRPRFALRDLVALPVLIARISGHARWA